MVLKLHYLDILGGVVQPYAIYSTLFYSRSQDLSTVPESKGLLLGHIGDFCRNMKACVDRLKL